MSKTDKKNTSARQRILVTAERLFYAEGIHSVGIDRIIAEAEVAKMTLYNHFSSKDELILAVLEYREEQVESMFSKSIERHVKKGKNGLEAFFAALKDWFKSPGFRGCSFINASVELADGNHPASLFSTAHKKRFHQMIGKYVEEVAGEAGRSIAPAISLLVEGAIVSAVMEQSAKAADRAKAAAMTLVSGISNQRR